MDVLINTLRPCVKSYEKPAPRASTRFRSVITPRLFVLPSFFPFTLLIRSSVYRCVTRGCLVQSPPGNFLYVFIRREICSPDYTIGSIKNLSFSRSVIYMYYDSNLLLLLLSFVSRKNVKKSFQENSESSICIDQRDV